MICCWTSPVACSYATRPGVASHHKSGCGHWRDSRDTAGQICGKSLFHQHGLGQLDGSFPPLSRNQEKRPSSRGDCCVRTASKSKRKNAVQVEERWEQSSVRTDHDTEEDVAGDISDGEAVDSTVSNEGGVQSDEEEEEEEIIGKWRKFDWRETADLLYSYLREAELEWQSSRKRFVEVNPPEGCTPLEFLPPPIQPLPADSASPADYLRSLRERGGGGFAGGSAGGKQLLVLLSASSAALGIYNEGVLTHHKIITAYTVRKSQGRAQSKHLRHGGGGGRLTVGGNLRARETRRLYTRINEKLKEWEKDIQGCELLFSSGGTRVWNEVFLCKDPPCVLQRDDPRWQKITMGVKEPRMRELTRVFYFLSHGGVGRPQLLPEV